MLSQYVVQQAALCSQLSSAVSVSLITDPTRQRKGVRKERERAGVVICTRHLGKDVEDVRRKETMERAEVGGVEGGLSTERYI